MMKATMDRNEVMYVVVEVWRGIATDAHVFRSRVDADECAERIENSANLIEDDVAVIETRVDSSR